MRMGSWGRRRKEMRRSGRCWRKRKWGVGKWKEKEVKGEGRKLQEKEVKGKGWKVQEKEVKGDGWKGQEKKEKG